MENFIVSARKYRPSTFNSVVGQQSITTTLKNAIQRKQLAQAYLFCGPRGVGKTTCARIFAKTINCLNQTPQVEACDACESCTSFNTNRSFNIHELDAASNNSVEGIRKLIDQVRVPPQIGKYSVYIIDEVHMLSQAAFNAFLKTLEEPPAHAIFILATTEKHKILPTILSRCQIFDFNRIKVEDTVKYLEHIAKNENVQYEPEALNIIAQKADGALRDALSIFDQVVSFSDNNITYNKVIENLNVLDYHYYFRLTEDFLTNKVFDTLTIFDELLSKGFDIQQFVSGLSDHFRNLLVCKDPQTVVLLEVGSAIAENYIQMAAKCTPDFLIRALDLTNQCDTSFRNSTNHRLHVELMLIKLSELTQEKKKDDNSESDDDQSLDISEYNIKAEPQPKSIIKEPPPETTRYKTTPKSVSIKDAMNGNSKKQEHKTIKPDESTEENQQQTNNVIDPEHLIASWKLFAENIKDHKPGHYSLLQTYLPVLNEGNQININFESQLQVDLFQEVKPDLIIFLRSKLNSRSFLITEFVQDQITQSKPYTDEEKFRYLSQKNPNLIKLKQNLNLDFS